VLSELELRVRHAIYETFAEGGIPLSATIADTLNIPADQVRSAYIQLHDTHVIVLDPHSKEVEANVDLIATAASKAKKIAGAYCANAERAQALEQRGYRFFAIASDLGFLRAGTAATIKALKR